jgi:hypothetical protein
MESRQHLPLLLCIFGLGSYRQTLSSVQEVISHIVLGRMKMRQKQLNQESSVQRSLSGSKLLSFNNQYLNSHMEQPPNLPFTCGSSMHSTPDKWTHLVLRHDANRYKAVLKP